MMMKIGYASIFFLLINLSAVHFCFAQNQTDSVTVKTEPHLKKSYLRASVGYLSNSVYNGRQDTVRNPYLNAEIGYYHKSRFNISAGASYQPNTKVIDIFSLDAGYHFDLSKTFSASFNADKPFYNKSSTSVSSGIKGSLNAALTYDPDFITFDASIGTIFSNKTDVLTTLSLSHLFLLDGFNDESFWSITPGLSANFGTQYFYQDYKSRSSKKKLISATSATVSGNNNFQVLDYEFSLPLSYDTKTWGITFLPTYAIPRNAITSTTTTTITTLNKTRTLLTTDTEKLKNVLYAEISLDFKFR